MVERTLSTTSWSMDEDKRDDETTDKEEPEDERDEAGEVDPNTIAFNQKSGKKSSKHA